MGSFSRKFRHVDSEVSEAQQRLPVGQVVTRPVKGDFHGLPVLGWVSRRKDQDTRLLMLALLLLRNNQLEGMLQMECPVYPETERAVVGTLQRLGWDGRIWPMEDGWPTGVIEDEQNIRHFLNTAKLEATLVFPPNSDLVNALLPLTVERAAGKFLMPPLPEPPDPLSPVLIDRFTQLCHVPTVFYPSRKDGEFIH